MRILVLGGDGYLGWPTAMYFSARGHDVAVVDNYLRRRTVLEAGSDSLTPVLNLHQRVEAWRKITGRTIEAHLFDLCDYEPLDALMKSFQPDAVVHYGQIPSAPYSMVDRIHATFTQQNNIVNNLNTIFAILNNNPEVHLVKLGTMGEYGCPNIDIEEGYIEIEHKGRKDTLPFPKLPHSWYHASKVADSTNIHFASRVYGLRATDLNQGVVYGVSTEETDIDPALMTRFDYDEQFGTALNRFCLQAVIGHPLTVYGTGGQTRGFLNIRDTLRCVELAVENPADRGEFRVFNQFTESFSIRGLAETVQKSARELGLEVEIASVENPRTEAQEHYYNPTHTKLIDLGLKPTLMSDDLVKNTLQVLMQHKDRAVVEAIAPRTTWS
ncbi:NAD-dependent epimerase/dehydratase family protein [Nocardioides marmoribigeumensis]|uniref:UDP-sulfoquinovose synthase n=1 Tax=Nocardioides marmoribigeumensis TaxID=433649 RepID=A0ABU2C1N7_9ACTN|nr:NAD-dependent epimerase/dehydratase family protein [Nocardioides marmoribigeumensis]MDR7364578.1 UDP-sulfoquinovose synthase [Nocardioides marmoribigeumensis]